MTHFIKSMIIRTWFSDLISQTSVSDNRDYNPSFKWVLMTIREGFDLSACQTQIRVQCQHMTGGDRTPAQGLPSSTSLCLSVSPLFLPPLSLSPSLPPSSLPLFSPPLLFSPPSLPPLLPPSSEAADSLRHRHTHEPHTDTNTKVRKSELNHVFLLFISLFSHISFFFVTLLKTTNIIDLFWCCLLSRHNLLFAATLVSVTVATHRSAWDPPSCLLDTPTDEGPSSSNVTCSDEMEPEWRVLSLFHVVLDDV